MNIFEEGFKDLPPIEKARQAARFMKQYQKDWEELGVVRELETYL